MVERNVDKNHGFIRIVQISQINALIREICAILIIRD